MARTPAVPVLPASRATGKGYTGNAGLVGFWPVDNPSGMYVLLKYSLREYPALGMFAPTYADACVTCRCKLPKAGAGTPASSASCRLRRHPNLLPRAPGPQPPAAGAGTPASSSLAALNKACSHVRPIKTRALACRSKRSHVRPTFFTLAFPSSALGCSGISGPARGALQKQALRPRNSRYWSKMRRIAEHGRGAAPGSVPVLWRFTQHPLSRRNPSARRLDQGP